MKVELYNNEIKVIEMTDSEEKILRSACKAVDKRWTGREYKVNKVVNVYDEHEKTFPRSLLHHLANLLEKKGYDIEGEDFTNPRSDTQTFYRKDTPELRENQLRFNENVAKDEDGIGVIISPTGTGKSEMVLELVNYIKGVTLIVVPTNPIKEELYQRLCKSFGKKHVSKEIAHKEKLKKVFARKKFLTKNNEERAQKMLETNEGKYLYHKGYRIGRSGLVKAGEREEGRFYETEFFDTPSILVICHNSIGSLPQNYIEQIELIISDEGHTYSENLLLLLRSATNCYYRYGFSATYLNDHDFEMKRLLYLFGNKIIYEELPEESVTGGRMAPVKIHELDAPKPKFPVDFFFHSEQGTKMVKEKQIDAIYKKGIVGNETRNKLITDLAQDLYIDGGRVLISVWEQDHTFILEEAIKKAMPDALVKSFHAGLSRKEKEEVIGMTKGHEGAFIVIGTWGIGIGADTKKVDRIILADSRISTIQNVQRSGRTTRVDYEGKEVEIYTIKDWFNEKLRIQSTKRLKALKEYFFGGKSLTEQRFSEIGVKTVRF